MQLIFCMQRNIRVFNKLMLSFVNGVASLPKIPKIRSLQYLTNNMLDYLDFRYVHRPTNHESNSLHKCQSRLLQMIIFIWKKEFSVQGWIMMFSWSEILWSHTNIIPVIIFNKKGVKVDLQNMRKQVVKVEKLIFNFVDSLVKKIYARC